MEIFYIVTHALSGLLLTMVGLSRLSNPIKTYSKNSGINIDNEVNLLNEVRGVSAVMLSTGVISLLGIFFGKISYIAFALAALIFLGFAFGRVISMVVDGKPNSMIVKGVIFEIVFGGLNVFAL